MESEPLRTNSNFSYEKGSKFKLKTYLSALRPWSLSGSFFPTLLGSTLAYRSEWSSNYSPAICLLTIFSTVTVHCAGNVVNTYFDFVKGIDKRKEADDRILVDNKLSKEEVKSTNCFISIIPIWFIF